MDDVRLIDANLVYKKILFFYNVSVITSRKEAYAKCLDIVHNATTVDAMPVKRGHWIATIDGLAPRIECSNCHISSRQNHLLAVSVDGSELPRFCPNCGADMRGDVDVAQS